MHDELNLCFSQQVRLLKDSLEDVSFASSDVNMEEFSISGQSGGGLNRKYNQSNMRFGVTWGAIFIWLL